MATFSEMDMVKAIGQRMAYGGMSRDEATADVARLLGVSGAVTDASVPDGYAAALSRRGQAVSTVLRDGVPDPYLTGLARLKAAGGR